MWNFFSGTRFALHFADIKSRNPQELKNTMRRKRETVRDLEPYIYHAPTAELHCRAGIRLLPEFRLKSHNDQCCGFFHFVWRGMCGDKVNKVLKAARASDRQKKDKQAE
jgi:hypothetical protein